jgi:hypothetical protein
MANSLIIGFYSGTQPDHRGRYLCDIQQWTDDQLESVHDYIQWLFPMPERSGFNMAAPVLTREDIQEFRTRPDLQGKVRASFLRMMTFYGFEPRPGEQITVRLAPNFAMKRGKWLSPSNHNHLRITRILRCLTVLGLEAEANAFFDCLREIYEAEQSKSTPAISYETMGYWREAVSASGLG